MAGSTPADLAVAFRSIPRRLAEALEPVEGDRRAAPAEVAAVDALLREAAAVLGTAADPAPIADELHERPADAWTDDDLHRLQELALRIGPLVRAVAARAEQAASGR